MSKFKSPRDVERGQEYLLAKGRAVRGSRRVRVVGSWGMDGLFIVLALNEQTGNALGGQRRFEWPDHAELKWAAPTVSGHTTVGWYGDIVARWEDRAAVFQAELDEATKALEAAKARVEKP